MRRECRERFPHHRLQRKPRVSDPSMHHGTCVTHVSWRMPGSLTRGGGENVPGIPGGRATRIFTYLARGPWTSYVVAFVTILETKWSCTVSFHLSGQNGRHFADDIFKCFFMNEKFEVCSGSNDNTSALVQVRAWRRTGDKLLPEPMLIQFADAYIRH